MRLIYQATRERWREADAEARRAKWKGIYVDPLCAHGWIKDGKAIQSCHLFCDGGNVEKLHEFAAAIGLKRAWFQGKPGKLPHYDLTEGKRAQAVRMGAKELGREEAVAIWRKARGNERR